MINQNQVLSFIRDNKESFKNDFHITKIGIFGSLAKEENTEKSDLDIIIEFEENTNNLFQIKKEIKHIFYNQFKTEIDICREKYIKPIFKNQILSETIYV